MCGQYFRPWTMTRALRRRLSQAFSAACRQTLNVIDQLIDAGTPVNEPDAEWQRLPLHTAAGNGRPASVRRLLAHGADPNLRDPSQHRNPLEECRQGDRHLD